MCCHFTQPLGSLLDPPVLDELAHQILADISFHIVGGNRSGGPGKQSARFDEQEFGGDHQKVGKAVGIMLSELAYVFQVLVGDLSQ